MPTRQDQDKLSYKVLLRPAAFTLILLSLPFLAMAFDWRIIDPGNPVPEQVNWDLSDFIIMGILIFSFGLIYEILKFKVGGGINRLALGLVLFAVFFLIWAELAVGIFD